MDESVEFPFENSALTLYTVKFNLDNLIHECEDAGRFVPDGINIAYIKSNYEVKYHANYEYLIPTEPIKTSNRGRKKKPVKPRTKKKEGGNNDKFHSEITFGIIHHSDPSIVHGMKIFRRTSGNIYTISGEDYFLAASITRTAFAFINKTKPSTNISLLDIDIRLHNMNFKYPLPIYEGKDAWYRHYVINVSRLRQAMSTSDFVKLDVLGKISIGLIIYNTKTFVRLIVKHGTNAYNFNILPSGKIYSYGGREVLVIRAIRDYLFKIIGDERYQIVQLGMRVVKATELKNI
jgi:hypothetical protein